VAQAPGDLLRGNPGIEEQRRAGVPEVVRAACQGRGLLLGERPISRAACQMRQATDAEMVPPVEVANSRPSSTAPNCSRCSVRMRTSSGGMGTMRLSPTGRRLRPLSSWLSPLSV
jgi:hypothetical protein